LNTPPSLWSGFLFAYRKVSGTLSFVGLRARRFVDKSDCASVAFNLGYGIALVPFGIHCLLTGYLNLKSVFLPRILGVLLAMAGLGYLTILWPPLGSRLFFPYLVIPDVVGEGSLTLWLLVMGVNAQRWKKQDGAGVK
jgi:hypothetical protein